MFKNQNIRFLYKKVFNKKSVPEKKVPAAGTRPGFRDPSWLPGPVPAGGGSLKTSYGLRGPCLLPQAPFFHFLTLF